MATRRPPHAFNFLRQIQILQKAGGPGAEQHFQDLNTKLVGASFESESFEKRRRLCFFGVQEWEQASGVAKAFKLGKLEAEAVSNLQCRVPRHIVDELSAAVRSRGLTRLVTHDLIAKDLLNADYSSGVGVLEGWREELRNGADHSVAPLIVMLIFDFLFCGVEGDTVEIKLALSCCAR